jgi:hypothetical protein
VLLPPLFFAHSVASFLLPLDVCNSLKNMPITQFSPCVTTAASLAVSGAEVTRMNQSHAVGLRMKEGLSVSFWTRNVIVLGDESVGIAPARICTTPHEGVAFLEGMKKKRLFRPVHRNRNSVSKFEGVYEKILVVRDCASVVMFTSAETTGWVIGSTR